MRRRAFLLLLPLIVAGCMEGQKPEPLPRKPSLYTRLGGEAKLEMVVDRFAALAAASTELRPAIRNDFRGPDVAGRKKQLVRRLGAALGGPYPGTLENLQQWFTALAEDVTPVEIGVMLGLLDRAMEEAECRPADRQDAMNALQPLRTQSVDPDE